MSGLQKDFVKTMQQIRPYIIQAEEFLRPVSEPAGALIKQVWDAMPEPVRHELERFWRAAVSFVMMQRGSVDIDLPSLAGIVAIFVGMLTLTVYYNWTPKVIHENAAVGASSKRSNDEDAPPIPPPTEVVAMYIYPIKSCRGIEISSTRLRKTGLTLDRNWMLIDAADGKFLTIRSDPSMTLIDTRIVEDAQKSNMVNPPPAEQFLEISINGKKDATVKIPAFPTRAWLEKNTKLRQVEIWEQPTDAWEYAEEINAVFSKFFKKPVALVFKGPQKRACAVNGAPELYGAAQAHHFADVMSLQVASAASMKDLNKRLGFAEDAAEALTVERFRPNIVVRGRDDAPWEEDTWKRVRISTTIPDKEALYKLDLDVVARCARCQVPNVNPDTADKDAHQPWDTLMKFRRVDQGGVAKYKPCFGMLCIPKNEGVIEIGATVEVLETTSKHLYNTRSFQDL